MLYNTQFVRSTRTTEPVLQFPKGTQVKVTGTANPESTTGKHFGKTGDYLYSGASPDMAVVRFDTGLATVKLNCLTIVEQGN